MNAITFPFSSALSVRYSTQSNCCLNYQLRIGKERVVADQPMADEGCLWRASSGHHHWQLPRHIEATLESTKFLATAPISIRRLSSKTSVDAILRPSLLRPWIQSRREARAQYVEAPRSTRRGFSSNNSRKRAGGVSAGKSRGDIIETNWFSPHNSRWKADGVFSSNTARQNSAAGIFRVIVMSD